MQEHESEQRAAARDMPGVREHETEQRAAAREEPGVREQEQSANTVSRAIARAEGRSRMRYMGMIKIVKFPI